jgi:hypothetical protein
MLGFIKKFFGSKPAANPAPYKVETPASPVEAKASKPKTAKKPTVKKATTRKPKAPKA